MAIVLGFVINLMYVLLSLLAYFADSIADLDC